MVPPILWVWQMCIVCPLVEGPTECGQGARGRLSDMHRKVPASLGVGKLQAEAESRLSWRGLSVPSAGLHVPPASHPTPPSEVCQACPGHLPSCGFST